MRRIVFGGLFTFALSLLLPLPGCTQNKEFQNPQKVFIALGAEPTTLDPVRATDTNSMRLCSLLFQSLVRLGPNLEIEGDAASTWTANKGQISFVLKPNLRFSNGRFLSKEDLGFSIDAFKSQTSPFSSAFLAIESYAINGDQTQGFRLDLFLSQSSFKLLKADLPVLKILPKAEYLEASLDFSKTPIGSGPLVLKKWSQEELIFEQNQHWLEHKIQPNQFVFKIIRDEFTRFQKMLKGTLDIAQTEISPLKISEFQNRPDSFQVFVYPGLSTTYLLINFQSSWLQAKSHRALLSQAIKKDEIIKYKLNDLATKAQGLLTPQNYYLSKDLPDLADQNAQIMVKKPPKALQFKTSNNQSAIDVSKVLSHQLNKNGITNNLQSFEWGTFYEDVQQGRFDLALMRWTGIIDPDLYRMAFHSSEWPPGRNRGRYKNQKLDLLLDQAEKVDSESKRKFFYDQVQSIVAEDIAIVPLWHDLQTTVVHKRIKGYKPWISSDFTPFLKVTKANELN